MQKFITLLAAGIVALALSACASVAVDQTQAAANLQKQVVKQCAIVTPFMSSMLAMQSQLSADAIAQVSQASADVSKVCAFANSAASGAAVSFSLPDVQTLASSAIPALIRVIDASPLEQAQKTAAEISITAAQIAISTAIAEAQ